MIRFKSRLLSLLANVLDEFDDFMARQENFNAYVSRQLKINAYMIGRLSDYMSRVKGELKLTSKHVSMVTTQAE